MMNKGIHRDKPFGNLYRIWIFLNYCADSKNTPDPYLTCFFYIIRVFYFNPPCPAIFDKLAIVSSVVFAFKTTVVS